MSRQTDLREVPVIVDEDSKAVWDLPLGGLVFSFRAPKGDTAGAGRAKVVSSG